MPIKKVKDQASILSRPIIVRLTESQYEKLEKLRDTSKSRSLGEIIRRIIENKPIKLLHKDISMNATMEELSLIRKEIKSIGVNINQQTHRFHSTQNPTEKSFHAVKTAEIYKQIEPKIDRLFLILSKLAIKWLQ